jgi:hypothetical protein
VCEGKGNFLHWGVESWDIRVEAQVTFDFFDKIVCFGSISSEGIGCYNASRRALESQRTKGTAEEETRLYYV